MAYIPPNVNGQAAMANSAPVVIASNQTNLPVAINTLIFPTSANNSSVAQLAASAIFVGVLENTQNLQAAQLEIFSDQPYTIFVEQFIDAAGTKLSSQDSFTRLANVPYSENITIPGNYFRVRVQNTGASATTTLQIDTTFGIMSTGPRTVTNLGNNRMAVNEIGGSALSIGQQLSAASIPVVIASDQVVKVFNPDAVVLATNITTQNLTPGGAATAGSAVEISLNSDATLTTQITGTYTGALSLQVTVNGTTWVTVGGTPFINLNTSTYLASITSALNSVFQSDVAGFIKARVTALAVVTGTAIVNLQASSATSMVALDTALPNGTNTIGAVTAPSGGALALDATLTSGITKTQDTIISGTIPAATIMQNAAVAVGVGVNLNVQGYASSIISVTGTMAAGTAITFEASVDDITFVAVAAHQIGFAGNLTTITISTGDFRISCAGYKSIRARISTYGTGTITAKGYSSPLAGHPTTVNSNIIASLPIGTNTIGSVSIIPSPPVTYTASITGLATGTLAGDILTITGSATKTVYVTRIDIDGIQTTASQILILMIKRSTADTGGTSTSPNKVPLDSLSAAATATVLAYTVNPTLGTAIGTTTSARVFVPAAATATDAQGISILYGQIGEQQMILRGITQVLAVNLNSVTIAGASININVEWTES